MATTVIVGLGNPIVSDDAVGIHVARYLMETMPQRKGVEIREAYAGGFRLMDELAGFDRAIVVDAMMLQSKPGTIHVFGINDGDKLKNITCTHDSGLDIALLFGATGGLKVPQDITILGIEALDVHTISESMTPEVRDSIPGAAAKIIEMIGGAP